MKGLFQVGLGLVAAGVASAQDYLLCAPTSLQDECTSLEDTDGWPYNALGSSGAGSVCGSLNVCQCPQNSVQAIYMRATVQVPVDYDLTVISAALAGPGAEFYTVFVSVGTQNEDPFCATLEDGPFVNWNGGSNYCGFTRTTELETATTNICPPVTENGSDNYIGGDSGNPKCICNNQNYGQFTEDELLEVNVVLHRVAESEQEPCEVSVVLVLNNHDENVEQLQCIDDLAFICEECQTGGSGSDFAFSAQGNETCAPYIEGCVADEICNAQLVGLAQGELQIYQVDSPNACATYECYQCHNALFGSSEDLSQCSGFAPVCTHGDDDDDDDGSGDQFFSAEGNQTCARYIEACTVDEGCNYQLTELAQGIRQIYQVDSPNACGTFDCYQCHNALFGSPEDLSQCSSFEPVCHHGDDDDDGGPGEEGGSGMFDEFFNTTCGTLLKACEQTPSCLTQLRGLMDQSLDESEVTDPLMFKLMTCAGCIFKDQDPEANVAICNTTAGLLPEEWQIFGIKYNETCGSLLTTCLDEPDCRAQVVIFAETNQVASNATADFAKLAACSVCLYNKADAVGPFANVTSSEAATCNSTSTTDDSSMASQSITSSLFMLLSLVAMFLRQ